MHTRILLTVALLVLAWSPRTLATDPGPVAHFGASFAITIASYGLAKKCFRMQRTEAVLFAAFVSLGTGLVKEHMDMIDGAKNFGYDDMWNNSLGVGAASLSIVAFEF